MILCPFCLSSLVFFFFSAWFIYRVFPLPFMLLVGMCVVSYFGNVFSIFLTFCFLFLETPSLSNNALSLTLLSALTSLPTLRGKGNRNNLLLLFLLFDNLGISAETCGVFVVVVNRSLYIRMHEWEMQSQKHPPRSALDTLTATIYQHKLLCLAAKLLSQGDRVLPKLPTALFNNNLSFYHPDIPG